MTDKRAIETTFKIILWSAGLVIAAAGILSFTALHDLFLEMGLLSDWLAWLFPLLFDLAEVAAAVTVLNAKLQGDEDRFAWRLVVGFTVAGIVANVAHAGLAAYNGKIDNVQFAVAIVATSFFPLSIALVTHLVKRTIERHIKRQTMLTSLNDLSNEIEMSKNRLSKIQADSVQLSDNQNAEKQRLEQIKADLTIEIEHLTEQRDQAILNTTGLNTIPEEYIQAVQIDALLHAGLTKKDAAAAVGVSRGTLNNRLDMVNGSGLRSKAGGDK